MISLSPFHHRCLLSSLRRARYLGRGEEGATISSTHHFPFHACMLGARAGGMKSLCARVCPSFIHLHRRLPFLFPNHYRCTNRRRLRGSHTRVHLAPYDGALYFVVDLLSTHPAWAKRRIAVVATPPPPTLPRVSFRCSFPPTTTTLSRVQVSASVSLYRSALPLQLRSKWQQDTRGRLSPRVPAVVSIRLPFSSSSVLLPFAHPLPSAHHGIHFRAGLARGSSVGLPR